MKLRSKHILSFCFVGILTCLLAVPLQGAVIVDDSFADGDFAKTGALDTSWWTSSSSSGKEISVGALGLVTGTSGRGIHTTFPAQTLANIGDSIKATYTFTTPATVGTNKSTSFRVGLFDNLGRLTANNPGVDPNDNRTDLCCLDADVNASSGSPNEVYGWGILSGGGGSQALPGYMFDHDVNKNDDSDDLNFREHTQGINATGRLMATTSNFDNISPSGPDEADYFFPNTTYTGMFQITRINATDVRLDGMLNNLSHSVTDTADSFDFGMLGFHVNSNTFGSSNSAGDPDNGIDFSNITIEFLPVPEPSSAALVLGAVSLLAGIGRRR